MCKKALVLLFLVLLRAQLTSAQNIDALPDTTLKRINAEIEKEIPALMIRLEDKNDQRTDKFNEAIQFGVDTFKIESFFRKRITVYHSTDDVNNACFYATSQYEGLLGKYYSLLSRKLRATDKQFLLAAQKSWLAFRNNELKLYQTLRADRYSGGGSTQSTLMAYQHLSMIKQRVLQLFEYYVDIY